MGTILNEVTNPGLPQIPSGSNSTREDANPLNALDAMVNNAAFIPLAKQAEAGEPVSFVITERFREYVKAGLGLEMPVELIPHVIVEHETTILFGDTGLGKTTLAFQYAMMMAEMGKTVFYVNFELSQQQLAKKFPDKEIPEKLYIASIDYTRMHDVTDQSQILAEIEVQALRCNCDVLIVDNLTNLCINSKEGAEAGNLMLRLISMRFTHQWTMLILAHVPKRKPADPLSLNDLAGSKILSNLADNVVGLNKSKLGKEKRYIIQLKYRSFPVELDYKNVQELTLTTSDGYLHFEHGEYAEERTHLPRSRDEKAELEHDIVKELKIPNGLSYRAIAEKLCTTLGNVQRVAKSHNLSRKAEEKGK